MCLAPDVKTPPPPPPPPAPPPPPEKPPETIENAVDSNATGLAKKRKGAKGSLGRGKSGVQIASTKSASSGLKIGA